MAKRKPEPVREMTRKETARRRRDAERNRRVIFGLIAVGVVLLALIALGVITETVIKPNRPVAAVNGAPIKLRDYQKQVQYTWYQQALQGQSVSDPQSTSLQVLDSMQDIQLLREQAKQRGITVTADEVDKAIEEMFGYLRETPTPSPTSTPDPNATPTVPAPSTEPTPTPAPTATPVTLESFQERYQAYISQLKNGAGLSAADFRTIVEQDLLRQKLYEAITADVPKVAEQVRVRHILVAIRTPAPTPEPTPTAGPDATETPTPDPNASPTPTPTPTPEPRDEAQALARITEIQQKLSAGEDFAALAQQYSDDPGSAANGGELPWFSADESYVKEFLDAAFALQNPGDVSPPVKTTYGYHLIKLEERDPARPLDTYTYQMKQYEAYQAWLDGLRSAAKIDSFWTLDAVPPTPVYLAGQ